MLATVSLLAGSDMELAMRRFRSVDREIRLGGWLRLWVAHVQLPIIQWGFARSIARNAANMNDAAIWFTGLSKSLMNENADVRPYVDAVVEQIDRVKKNINDNRRAQRQFRERHHRLINNGLLLAMDFDNSASARLFEAFDEFKWTLLELQANHSPRDEGYAASTPEDLAALFERIKSEA